MSALAEVATERVALRVDDGTTMRADVVRPASGAHGGPGIVIFQDAYGVNDQLRGIAARFAALGCTAIAPELYHRTGEGIVGAYDAPDDPLRRRCKDDITTDGLLADARAAYDWLRTAGAPPERIAALGFCMGGRVVFLANAHLPLAAAISFYGGGIAPGLLPLAPRQHAELLMFWGGRDRHIPVAQRRAVEDALTAAEKPHAQAIFAQAGHGFFGPTQATYDPGASGQAWALASEFLRVRGVLPAG